MPTANRKFPSADELAQRATALSRSAERRAEALALAEQAVAAGRKEGGPTLARTLEVLGDLRRRAKVEGDADCFSEALALYEAMGDAGLPGVARQELNFGRLALRDGAPPRAGHAFRRAVAVARAGGDPATIAGCATRLAQYLADESLFTEAGSFFAEALSAAKLTGDERLIFNCVCDWRDTLRSARRWREAILLALGDAAVLANPRARFDLLENALADVLQGGEFDCLDAAAAALRACAAEMAGEPDRHQAAEAAVAQAEERKRRAAPPPPQDGVPMVFDFVMQMMSGERLEAMCDAAELLCGVALGAGIHSGIGWEPFMPEPALAYRAVGDTLLKLAQEEKAEIAFEISQRFKAVAWCLPQLRNLLDHGAPHAEAQACVEAWRALADAVARLRMPGHPGGQRLIQAALAAGANWREACAVLHRRDPALHAELGGVVRAHELIDALPAFARAGIVDLTTIPSGTLALVAVRAGSEVVVKAIFAKDFRGEHVAEIRRVLLGSDVSRRFDAEQADILRWLARLLHDKLMCPLGKILHSLGIGQLIVVPDPFTTGIPLHIAEVCGKEFRAAKDAPVPEYFAEAFPIEYAPSVQSVVLSVLRKRPPVMRRMVSFDDPGGDLPGARQTASWLAEAFCGGEFRYESHAGASATLAEVAAESATADVLMFGTHGRIDPAEPERSHLVLHDGNWTLRDVLGGSALPRHPAVVLAACELGSSDLASDFTGRGCRAGLPGAFLARGAAFVLASMWPLDDFAGAFLVERFFRHISHQGHRPSAALSLAVRDLRRWSKADAAARAKRLLDAMKEDGRDETQSDLVLLLKDRMVTIEDGAAEFPFAETPYWGGLIVIGSGWHAPSRGDNAELAVKITGGPATTRVMLESMMGWGEANDLVADGKYAEAMPKLLKLLATADGCERADQLRLLAGCVWGLRRPCAEPEAREEALDLLAQAESIAASELAESLLAKINAARQWIASASRIYHVQT